MVVVLQLSYLGRRNSTPLQSLQSKVQACVVTHNKARPVGSETWTMWEGDHQSWAGRKATEVLQKWRKAAGHVDSASQRGAEGEQKEWSLTKRHLIGNGIKFFYYSSCLTCPVVRQNKSLSFSLYIFTKYIELHKSSMWFSPTISSQNHLEYLKFLASHKVWKK